MQFLFSYFLGFAGYLVWGCFRNPNKGEKKLLIGFQKYCIFPIQQVLYNTEFVIFLNQPPNHNYKIWNAKPPIISINRINRKNFSIQNPSILRTRHSRKKSCNILSEIFQFSMHQIKLALDIKTMYLLQYNMYISQHLGQKKHKILEFAIQRKTEPAIQNLYFQNIPVITQIIYVHNNLFWWNYS